MRLPDELCTPYRLRKAKPADVRRLCAYVGCKVKSPVGIWKFLRTLPVQA